MSLRTKPQDWQLYLLSLNAFPKSTWSPKDDLFKIDWELDREIYFLSWDKMKAALSERVIDKENQDWHLASYYFEVDQKLDLDFAVWFSEMNSGWSLSKFCTVGESECEDLIETLRMYCDRASKRFSVILDLK
jgi:hypothetical protein